MNKEEQIQELENKQLIDELSKMPPMVLATAYLHAINYTLYGEDVTEKWVTATQNASALEKAYMKGYYDALANTGDAIDRIVQKAKDAANGKAEYMTMEEVFKEDCELKGENNGNG